MNLSSNPRLMWLRLTCVSLIALGPTADMRAQDEDLIGTFHVSPVKPVDPATRPEYLPRPSENEQAILEALHKQVEVVLRDIDLPDAMNHLKETHGIEIWVDTVQLKGQEISVTLESSSISLRSCLNLLLEPHGLSYFVEDDVLKVTTRESAETKLITRTYPADDLFASAEDAIELTGALTCGLGLSQNTDHQRSLIVSAPRGVIIARQSHRVHNELLQLLQDLRATRANAAAGTAEVAKSAK
ncbi:MAG: hypothetical protein JSS49_21660 [Planctomycetes bacterium]|nr:hypothetical protein [Planctomycetota bacterium]